MSTSEYRVPGVSRGHREVVADAGYRAAAVR